MPFKSEAQRRFLFAKHPTIAKRWAHEYPLNGNKLPKKLHPDKTVKDANMAGFQDCPQPSLVSTHIAACPGELLGLANKLLKSGEGVDELLKGANQLGLMAQQQASGYVAPQAVQQLNNNSAQAQQLLASYRRVPHGQPIVPPQLPGKVPVRPDQVRAGQGPPRL